MCWATCCYELWQMLLLLTQMFGLVPQGQHCLTERTYAVLHGRCGVQVLARAGERTDMPRRRLKAAFRVRQRQKARGGQESRPRNRISTPTPSRAAALAGQR